MTQAPGKRYKTRGTDWWTPAPLTPLNAAIPYVVQIVEDALSLTQRLILRIVAARENHLKNDTGQRGFLCDPGGYTRIAKQAGVCRKTVYNAIKALKKKGVLREYKLVVRGKQREKTIYYAAHYGDILPAWRADPTLFHTNAEPARVVALGRCKTLATVEVAGSLNMDPDRAPLRGCGRGRSEFVREKAARIAAAAPPEPLPSDADLLTVREAFLKCCPSNLKDTVDIIHAANAEARKMGGAIAAAVIAELMLKIAREYKPSREWPEPRPKYFIGHIAAQVAYWVKQPEERSRTG
jgi:DNA-binding Lrp family transcriptional regulator